MKTLYRAFAVAIIGGSLAVAGGCASTRTKQSGTEYVNDAVITSKVKTKLVEDQALKAFQIDVETFRGDVLLSGFVDNQEQIGKAVEVAKSVDGVKAVKNSLIVKKEKQSES